MYTNTKNAGTIILIETEKIVPNRNQPRKSFNEAEILTLAQSIRNNGIIQPLTVRRTGEKYELIAGERRLRASKKIGLSQVPCLIMEADDCSSAVYALIENIQRKDLTFLEEARSIKVLVTQYGMRQDEIAVALGKTQSAVSNLMRILKLPQEILEKIEENNLTQRHARALLLLNEEDRETALQRIIEKNLNVKQTDTLIEEMLTKKPPRKKPKLYIRDVRIFLNTVTHAVDTMKNAGLNAKMEKTEDGEYYTFLIKVPKNKGKG